jgi:BirA family biotin operon repressor/biotin-[acetyl-CoA-carboxylase] ligase
VAAHQHNGRGQANTTWESEPGQNLLFSTLLLPQELEAEAQVSLNITICLALYDLVNEFFPDRVRIKWPNDIYVDDKKIAGILIESTLSGNRIKTCIVGIGLNVNQQAFSSPLAVSMKMLDEKERNQEEVLDSFIQKLRQRYAELYQYPASLLLETYLRYMFRLNTLTPFSINGETVEAAVCGMDQQGRLHLCVNGESRFYHNKEVKWLI